MVDRSARNILAELIHQFAAGRVENFDFENRVPESEDFAIREIGWCGCWPLYDDFRTHRMVGKWRIPDESRPEIAKWILFLHSDYEYEWKPRTWPGNPGGSLATADVRQFPEVSLCFSHRRRECVAIHIKVPV